MSARRKYARAIHVVIELTRKARAIKLPRVQYIKKEWLKAFTAKLIANSEGERRLTYQPREYEIKRYRSVQGKRSTNHAMSHVNVAMNICTMLSTGLISSAKETSELQPKEPCPTDSRRLRQKFTPGGGQELRLFSSFAVVLKQGPVSAGTWFK